MQHSDFEIGLEFWCAGKRWRCTDLGTGVITAICLKPREMVQISIDPSDKTKRTERRLLSDDPVDLNGPPYGVLESVFDENDIEACSVQPEDTCEVI